MSASASPTQSALPFAYTPSTIILNPLSQVFVDQANVQIAPWVMGTIFDVFLLGILVAQVTHYFAFSPGVYTQRRFTYLVILVTILSVLKSAQDIVVVWHLVIQNYANPDAAFQLLVASWVHYTTSLTGAIVAIVVQSFFVYRYWMLTKRWYACLVISVGMVLSLVASCLVVVYMTRLDLSKVREWGLVHFGSAIAVDSLITGLTAFYLHRQRTYVYSTTVTNASSLNGRTTMEIRTVKSTTAMIDRLIRMTWQTALPPTICVTINAAVMEGKPNEMTHIAFNIVLPKLYALSLMYTLNMRNEMRGERMGPDEFSVNMHSRGGSQSRTEQKRTIGGSDYRSHPRREGEFRPHPDSDFSLRSLEENRIGLGKHEEDEFGASAPELDRDFKTVDGAGAGAEGVRVEMQIGRPIIPSGGKELELKPLRMVPSAISSTGSRDSKHGMDLELEGKKDPVHGEE